MTHKALWDRIWSISFEYFSPLFFMYVPIYLFSVQCWVSSFGS